MNKFLLIVSLVLATSIFSFAQTETKKASEQWQNFAPLNEEFSALVPVSLSAVARTKKNNFYTGYLNGTYFFIFSDSPKNPFQAERVSEFAKSQKATESALAFGNFSGEKYSFADDENFYHTIFKVETKNRVYVFQTTSEIENNPLAERFFASIQLNRTVERKDADAKDENAQTDERSPVQNNGGNHGVGSGSGMGSGGIGSGAAPIPQTPSNQTSPLKILSKPKPNYTDAARFYAISGRIPLRVTFLADGSIGSVSPISKLPFGLMNSAIKAAQGIKFEPAMKDGTAVSVTKIVEYGFSIY